ncbi:MAG: polysaccharide deacetylase family protein [bacterium]
MTKRGVVTFVFDDGYERVYQNALPLLNKYNMPAVFAVSLDAPKLTRGKEFRKIRPWQGWLPLRHQGHEIASHTVTHPDLTKIDAARLDHELQQSARLLNTTTLVYPGGAFNDDVVRAASKYYTAARTIKKGLESLPPRDALRLKVKKNYSRNNFSVLKANLRVLWAYLTNSWIIETFHMIDDDDQQMVHTVKTSDFSNHLAFVSRLPIQVKTICDCLGK